MCIRDSYRDLAEGLIRSTRQKEARNTKYNALVKEELISLVGANMLGQENRFNAVSYTHLWLRHWETNFPMEKPFTKYLAVFLYSIQTRAVSYTHLDVYKRQGRSTGPHLHFETSVQNQMGTGTSSCISRHAQLLTGIHEMCIRDSSRGIFYQ